MFRTAYPVLTGLIFLIVLPGFAQQGNAPDAQTIQNLLDQSSSLLSTNPPEAIRYAKQSADLAVINGLTEQTALAYKTVGTGYYYLGKFDSTAFYWNRSMRLLESVGGKPLADAYNNMGVIYQQTGKSDSCYLYYNRALKLRKQLHDTLGVASSYVNLGSLQRSMGNYEIAQEYNFKALELYEALNLSDKVGDVYNSIGLVYLSIRNYSESLKYLELSLEIKLRSGNARGIGNTLNNLASAYEGLEDWQHAEDYYLQAEAIFLELGDKRMLAAIAGNLGVIYRKQGLNEKAIENYLQAAEGFEKLRDLNGLATVYSNLGSLYYLEKEYKSAEESFLNALDYAHAIESLPIEKTACEGLANTYVKLEDYKNALYYNEQYVALNDSIFSVTTAEKIAELQERYEFEKKSRKIIELENASLENEKTLQQNQFIIWLVSVGGISLLVVLLLALNRFKLKRRVLFVEKERYRLAGELKQKEIDLKNRELTGYAGSILQKSKFMQDVLTRLEKLELSSNEAILQAEGMKREIRSAIDDQDDWDKFKLHFEQVHPQFFEALKADFPALTVNDLKHCAYIRMNLSVKEVANLMNISPKSAKMNRYRLKKKLNLEESRSLTEFILGRL